MKLASYHGTRAGVMGLGNILIRWRLRGQFSHTEVMFEPGDGVDYLMPDGTCAPDADGALWFVSAVGLERMPPWSHRRAGRLGGVRFKRIVPEPGKWTLQETGRNPLYAAKLALSLEGSLYDWQLIGHSILWLVREKGGRTHCAELAARLLGFAPSDAWRSDPCILPVVVRWMAPLGKDKATS